MITRLIEFLLGHATFEGPGILKVEGPLIVVVPIAVAMVYGAVASIVWAYKDAVLRNKDGWVAVLFILATGWPFSFLWWFWLRPPLKLGPEAQQNVP